MNKKHFSFLLILLLILGISFYQEKRVDINSSNVKEEIKYHFRNEELLDSHYQKHGIEMGFDSPTNYEIAANKVILNPLSLHKIQDDGDDIYLLEDLAIEPNEIKKIPTGIKSFFEKDEVLFLIVRSSMGFKYNIRLCNQVGVIDADYYNNPSNEGHIWVKIQNEGKEKVVIPQGESIVQGIFLKYLTTQSDRNINIERTSDY